MIAEPAIVPRAISAVSRGIDGQHRPAGHVGRQPEDVDLAAHRVGALAELARAGQVAHDPDQRRALLARALRVGEQRHDGLPEPAAVPSRRAARILSAGGAQEQVAQLERVGGER